VRTGEDYRDMFPCSKLTINYVYRAIRVLTISTGKTTVNNEVS
jgi:hypothetical protein